jgi:hypothetical protein
MSEWDFLHDMYNEGYSPDQIADAAACGYNPWVWQPIYENEIPEGPSQPDPELVVTFESLVDNAMTYHELTGRYLQIWGELGELYAEIEYGIKRHKPHTRGSDGKLGNDFIEIKTISPEKAGKQVQVKRAGNFNKLLLIGTLISGHQDVLRHPMVEECLDLFGAPLERSHHLHHPSV